MALQFVSQANTGTSRLQDQSVYNLPKPPGLAVGDGMVAWLESGNGAITLNSAPAGWTVVVNERFSGVGYRRIIATKIADAADVAASTFAFTWSANATGQGFTFAYRDIDPANFFTISARTDAGLESSGPGGNVTVTCPSVVTVEPNSLLLRFASFQGFNVTDDGFITEEAGHTERLDLAIPNNGWTLGFQEQDTPQTIPGPSATQQVTGTGLDAAAGEPDYRTEAWTAAIAPLVTSGGGAGMAAPSAPSQPQREAIERGMPIKNPFGGRMRRNACMCIGKCVCS